MSFRSRSVWYLEVNFTDKYTFYDAESTVSSEALIMATLKIATWNTVVIPSQMAILRKLFLGFACLCGDHD